MSIAMGVFPTLLHVLCALCACVGQGRAPIVLYTVWGVGTCVGCVCSVFPKISISTTTLYVRVAGEKWLFLLPKRWNKHVQYAWQYAWRYAPRELNPESDAAPLESAPRVELGASDDEYLTEDECMTDA